MYLRGGEVLATSPQLPNKRREPRVAPCHIPPCCATADVSQPTDIFALPKSIYSPSHAVSSSTPLNDPSRHPHFVHTPGGSPSARHQSFPSQHLNRHVSDPNIRSTAAQPAPHYLLSQRHAISISGGGCKTV